MSKARIEQMLQECLDGYEAGLTPEECLSAYPAHRVELEPMLRQALSLRVAYATSPSDEFRHQTRENLMFAAGRDVQLALSSEPDPSFVQQGRARFLNVAGATAQEALRDVPPPRLAFWINARRRLLEAAGTTPTPARRFAGMLRYSLTVAVLAIAIGVGAYVSLDNGATPSADAQLAALEQRITNLQQRTLQGQPVTAGELEDLAEQTSQITSALDGQDLARAEKIGGLIVKQQELAQQADGPELAGAQQKLDEAQQKLSETTGVTPTVAVAVVETTETLPTPAVTQEPTSVPTPEPFGPDEVRVEASDDGTLGLTWQSVTTENVSFVMPENWRLLGVEEGEDGNLTQTGTFLRVDTDGDIPVVVVVAESGETTAQVNGVALQLRGPGPDGATIAASTLADNLGEIGLALHNFVLSIEVTAP
jgi:hypothetical protein